MGFFIQILATKHAPQGRVRNCVLAPGGLSESDALCAGATSKAQLSNNNNNNNSNSNSNDNNRSTNNSLQI